MRSTSRVTAIAAPATIMFVVLAASAAAHPGHSHGDGRIPGFPDFKRVGDEEYRFHPDKGLYSHKRPGEKPRWFHADFPPAEEGFSYDLPTSEEPVVCATSGHRIRIVYSSTASPATPTTTQINGIRSIVRRMNWKIKSEALLSSGGGRALRMRVDCDANGEIKIYTLTSESGYIYDIWDADDSLGEPTGANAVKNLIFFDGADPFNAWGYGDAKNDSLKSSSDASTGNDNRITTTSATIYNHPDIPGFDAWKTHSALHELFHAMGAVQPTAPFATSKYHCTDGIDTMCYVDESPEGYSYSETRCPASAGYGTEDTVPLDCAYDSYFDAVEESGEWLNTHWNIGGIENPYLTPSTTWPECDYNSFTSSIKTGHINSDGRTDIFQFAGGGQGLHGWLAPTSGSTYAGLSQIGTGFGSPYQDRIADIDGDGDDDVFQVLDDGRVYAWLSNGSSYIGLGLISNQVSTNGACEIRILDFNGDGRDDIMRFASDGKGYVWQATGNTQPPSASYTYLGQKGDGYGPAIQMRSGDMDGDGDDDLYRFQDSGTATGWTSYGTGFMALGTIGTGFGNNYQVQIADKDNDGDDDIFRFPDNGTGSVWRADTTPYIWYTPLGQLSPSFGGVTRQMRTVDMNADGRADIIKFADTGIGYGWQAQANGSYNSLGQIGTGFGAP